MKAHVRLRGRRWYAIVEAPKDAGGNRKRKWRRLPAGLKGKKEAETEAAKLIVKMSSATYLEPSKTTLAVYLDRWLDHMRSQVSPRSVVNYREVVTININPLLGHSPLSKLKPAGSPRHGVTHRIDKMSERLRPCSASTGAATATGELDRASGWMIRQDLPETSSEERKERKATEKGGVAWRANHAA